MLFSNLVSINWNENGDYYFIYSVPNVVNHIKPGSKSLNELIIVGVPQSRLCEYLNRCVDNLDVFVDLEEPV